MNDKLKQKNIYITTDGKEWNFLEDAEKHQVSLDIVDSRFNEWFLKFDNNGRNQEVDNFFDLMESSDNSQQKTQILSEFLVKCILSWEASKS